MPEVFGKQVYATLAELVQPDHTALVVIGVCGGSLGDRQFARRPADTSGIEAALPRIGKLVQEARRRGVFLVWVEDAPLEAGLTDSGPLRRAREKRLALAPPGGDAKTLLLENALPARSPGEVVVPKLRLNAFFGTHLDMVLRRRAIETVMVAGVATELTVESTARSAIYQDYYSVIVTDCVASWDKNLHRASLQVMASQCDCAALEEVLGAWGSWAES